MQAIARAIFDIGLLDEARTAAIDHVQSVDWDVQIEHVLDVMWEKAKPFERAASLDMAERIAERMRRRTT